MKRLLAATAIGVLAVAGGASTTMAQDDDSYFSDALLLVSDDTLAPGEEFEATLQGCTPGETVEFTINSSTTATCDSTGTASGTLTAPSTPGTYDVTGVGLESGASDSESVTVVAAGDGDDDADDGGTLPETGSSTTPLLQIGGVLLVAGLGVLGVAKFRRRPLSA